MKKLYTLFLALLLTLPAFAEDYTLKIGESIEITCIEPDANCSINWEVKGNEISVTSNLNPNNTIARVTAMGFPFDAIHVNMVRWVMYNLITGEANYGDWNVFTIEPIDVSGISIDQTELNLYVGDSFKLKATITPDNATYKNIEWYSDNDGVATVDAQGIVTAVADGIARIAAVHTNPNTGETFYSGACVVNVSTHIAVSSITIDDATDGKIVMTAGDAPRSITATVGPDNATNKELIWTSSDEDVANFDQNGNLCALKAGATIIRASAADGGGATAYCLLTVNSNEITAEKIVLNNSEYTMTKGTSLQLTVTYTPAEPTDKSIRWTSSDPAVAKVEDGLVTALAAGKAAIIATTANGLTAVCTVEVAADVIDVESITLNMTNAIVREGEMLRLNATVAPTNATNQAVIWISDNEAVAKVDEYGIVEALVPGNATITATAGGKSATCAIKVTAIVVEVEEDVDIETLTLNLSQATIKEGAILRLEATITPANATNQAITWTSSNAAVAKVDAYGIVEAVAPGTATITATAADGSGAVAQCEVSVTALVAAENIELICEQPIMAIGATQQLSATLSPVDVDNKQIVWFSSDKTIATVNESGIVTAVAPGIVTISAVTHNSLVATCYIKVSTATAIEGIEGGSKVSVSAENGVIIVNAPEGTPVEVYAITGTLLRSTREHRIDSLGRGIYIIRVAGCTFKLSL
jgi:uncharacterized protein YjdB